MVIVKQDTSTWFVDSTNNNIDLLNFFDSDFIGKNMANIKGQHSIIKEFGDLLTDDNKRKFLAFVANNAIKYIISSSKGQILKKIPFHWLRDFQQYHLRQAVMELVQHLIRNRQLWEKTSTSSFQSATISVSQDINTWLVSNDAISRLCWNSIDMSKIGNTKIIPAKDVMTYTANGNVLILGSISDDTMKELKL